MRRMLVALMALVPARVALADADSLVDHLGPAETGVGEAKRAGAVGALATRLNPAGLPLSTELVFDGWFGYRPGDHASVASIAACDSTNALPGCFYYTYVGAEPEVDGMAERTRTHTGGMTLSKAVSSRFIVGVGAKYFDVETEGMDAGSGFNWDIGSTLRLTETANLAVVGYNLWGAESEQFPRGVGAGFLIRPTSALAASFDAVWNLDVPEDESTGRYGGGLEYFLTGKNGMVGYPLRAGALHDVGQEATHLTAGVGFASMKMGIDVAARRQVSGGGDELLVTAAIRLFGPRQPQAY